MRSVVRWFGLSGREGRLAAVSAVLLFLAFAPFHLLAPSFLALVPLSVMAWSARTPRRAARGGVLFGVVHYGLLLHWMVPALLRVTAAAPMVYASAVLLLALSAALVCWTLGRLRHDTRIPLWLALSLAWTAGEWLVAHLPGTLAYPWLGLGTSLTGYPGLVGVAELVGARGVTFWLALVNGLVAEAVVRVVPRHPFNPPRSQVSGRRAPDARPQPGVPERSLGESRPRPGAWDRLRPARPWLAAALAVAAGPSAWGVWRAAHLDLRPGPVVAAARTTLRAGPGDAIPDLAALAAVDSLLVAGTEGGPAPALVVLPEGTLRDGLGQPEVVAGLQDLSRRLGAPVLAGVVRAGERGVGRFNSAVVAGPRGLPGEPYDKRHLVPWVERIPLEGLLSADGEGDGFRAGGEWTVLDANAHTLGVLICYEAAFAGAARALRRAGAEVLVNITNDAWFARAGALAIAQHEAHLVMRAIETRTGVVRAANFGPAGFIDPAGRVRARTSGPEAAVVSARVDAIRDHTWFVRLGDLAGPGATAALLVLLLATALGRPASPEATPHARPSRSPRPAGRVRPPETGH